MNLNEYVSRPFTSFDKEWALVTAGDIDHFNTMTVSWGAMGTLWNKPVIIVFIKPVRYTAEFLASNDQFTVSFYGEQHRKALRLLGTKSGRDSDKIRESGLKPVAAGMSVTFREADKTFLLKKIYMAPFDPDSVPPFAHDLYYKEEAEHFIVIGEVIDIVEEKQNE